MHVFWKLLSTSRRYRDVAREGRTQGARCMCTPKPHVPPCMFVYSAFLPHVYTLPCSMSSKLKWRFRASLLYVYLATVRPFFKVFRVQPCAGRTQWAEHDDINFLHLTMYTFASEWFYFVVIMYKIYIFVTIKCKIYILRLLTSVLYVYLAPCPVDLIVCCCESGVVGHRYLTHVPTPPNRILLLTSCPEKMDGSFL